MLIDLLRMTSGDAGNRKSASGTGTADRPFVLRLLRRIMPILIVADVFLFWRGIFTGGVGLAILLFALRIFLKGAFEDVAEAEEASPGQVPGAGDAARHPFDRWMQRVTLVGRFGFASFLGVATTVLFLAGTLMGVSFFTKYFENEGYIPARGRAEAVVVGTARKCRLRGRNGEADTYLDEALCQLRRDRAVRREIVPFVTLRFPLSDGTVHTVEGRRYTMARGKVAVGDTVPITYDLDNPDRVHKRIPNFVGKMGKSFPIPFVLLAFAYGAARWRRHLLGEPSPAGRVVRRARREREEEGARTVPTHLAGDAGAFPERPGRPPVATFMTGPRSRRNGSAFGARRG